MQTKSLVRIGIFAVLLRFVFRYIAWLFLIGMIPLLVLKDLIQDPQPGLGHAIWMMTVAPLIFFVAAGVLITMMGKRKTTNGAVAILVLMASGFLCVMALGAFFKGFTSLGEDHIAPLFSDNSPAKQQAYDLYQKEVHDAYVLGYTKENDPYLIRYYRDHPPHHDSELREPVRHELEQIRSNGGK